VPKVFCIGFHKTGTTSMRVLLEALGYRVQGHHGVRDAAFVERLRAGDLGELLELAREHDAFEDNPWPIFFRELDRHFPGSQFILTVRDPASWVRSAVDSFGRQPGPGTVMRELVYGFGSPVGHEDVYRSRFERHQREVREHFRGREEDLLVVDLAEPEALARICGFLGKPPPFERMPHANRGPASSRPRWLRRLRELAAGCRRRSF